MSAEREVQLPDIGDFDEVDVVEVLVEPGQEVKIEDSLIVLESDKATMEIPSPYTGVVKTLHVGVGDKVGQGHVIAVIEVSDEAAAEAPVSPAEPESAHVVEDEHAHERVTERYVDSEAIPPPAYAEVPAAGGPAHADAAPTEKADVGETAAAPVARQATVHASPLARRVATELGVELAQVAGSGRRGRVLKEDVQSFVKGVLTAGSSSAVSVAGIAVARPLEIDFSAFGETEIAPLNRVRKLSARNLHRSWVTAPHVTQFDEADVTALETFRKAHKEEAKEHGTKLTFLPFAIKAVTRALREFPQFNSSLDHTGENLVLKKYFHVGVAVDTPNGLVVPVVRDADQKGLFDLAGELSALSDKARTNKLRVSDLQGGSFTISSLGGIGGTFFTPIINHPEVAILGISKMEWRPVHSEGEFIPRLIVPLSLSYDHRVIDGADAVRFTKRLAELLSDLRILLL